MGASSCCCRGPSSSSSKKSSSSSGSSSSIGCYACQNCLAMDFPGLTAAMGGGCTGTFYASNLGIYELTAYDGQWGATGAPNCNQWLSSTGVGLFTWVLKTSTSPPQFELTFNCGSTPYDKAIYVKSNGDTCPTGTYNLSSRTQPGYAITWPSSLTIFNTTTYQPASLPTTLTLTWDASTLDPAADATTCTLTSGVQTISDYGKVQSCTYGGTFKRNSADPSDNMSAQATWSCQGGMTVSIWGTFGGLGTATTAFSYQMSGGNPARMWPTSGSVFHAVYQSTSPNLFANPGPGVPIDITLTY